MSNTLTNNAVGDENVILRWRVHLAKEQPQKLAVVLGAVAATGVLALGWYGSLLPAALMAFALFGALSDFLLPMNYTFTSTHVSASTAIGKRLMAWKDVRNVYADDQGVKLSPLARHSRLEAYRGVYVRFGDKRAEVLEAVKGLTEHVL